MADFEICDVIVVIDYSIFGERPIKKPFSCL